MTTIVTMDLESRSTVDLNSTGVWPYAVHPTTEYMCQSIAVNGDKPLIWIPEKFYRLLVKAHLEQYIRYEVITERRMLDIISSADILLAQNCEFELIMNNENAHRYRKWPKIPLEKFHDLMAQLAMCALPLNLDMAGAALGMPIQKDAEGHKAMLKLCKPRTPRKKEKEQNPLWAETIYWNEDPKDILTLVNYCGKDVESERIIYHHLPKLPPKERAIWLMHERINMRGVPIDMANVNAIVNMIESREAIELARFQKLVNGEVSGPRAYVKLAEWINDQLPNIDVTSVDKNAAAELMQDPTVPDHIKEILKVKAELSKASVAKFKAMQALTLEDERARGLFVYHGASTGRWASRAIQIQNLPRDSYKPKIWEAVMDLINKGDFDGLNLLFDDPYFVASRCVRGAFCAKPGYRFICADFSAIEARMAFWLAGEEEELEDYRNNIDKYKKAAAGTFNVSYDEVNDAQRQVGKCQILFLNYLGGIGAFKKAAKSYNIDLETLVPLIMPSATDDEINGDFKGKFLAKQYLKQNPGAMSMDAAIACDIIKQRYRLQHQPLVRFANNLNEAAMQAVKNPGKTFRIRNCKFCVNDDFLRLLLPSGRILYYYKPQIDMIESSWGSVKETLTYMALRMDEETGKTTRQWIRQSTYAGRWIENVDQAISRDILALAMLRLEAAGYPMVLHVHDEPVSELPYGKGSLEEFMKIMIEVPSWAKGLPIAAEGWEGERYRK